MTHSIFPRASVLASLVGFAVAVGAQQAGTPQTGTPAGASPPLATGTAPVPAAPLSHGDRKFVEEAAIGSMAEVEMGNLAQQKAGSDAVKQFGRRMVTDHSKANDELKQVAASKGMQVPAALDEKHKKDLDRLSKMTGADFDKAYMSHMLDDHKKDVADFKKQASSAKDQDVKAFASKTLPTLQEHLQLAQTTDDAVKKSK